MNAGIHCPVLLNIKISLHKAGIVFHSIQTEAYFFSITNSSKPKQKSSGTMSSPIATLRNGGRHPAQVPRPLPPPIPDPSSKIINIWERGRACRTETILKKNLEEPPAPVLGPEVMDSPRSIKAISPLRKHLLRRRSHAYVSLISFFVCKIKSSDNQTIFSQPTRRWNAIFSILSAHENRCLWTVMCSTVSRSKTITTQTQLKYWP